MTTTGLSAGRTGGFPSITALTPCDLCATRSFGYVIAEEIVSPATGLEMLHLSEEFERALLSLDRLAAKRILEHSAGGAAPLTQVEALVVPALERIGSAWESGALSLSQVYMSGRICEELVDGLLAGGSPRREVRSRMAICVLEDYHMLGKRMVYSTLRAAGFELNDYGRVSAEDLVRRITEDGIRLILISTLMFPSALKVKEVRARLAAERADAKIVVGGAPFRLDRELWRLVGADAVGCTASDAIRIVAEMEGLKPCDPPP